MICQEVYMEETMKPIFHPPLDAITLEGIFHALSDPARAAIFANIAFSQCAQNCTAFAQINSRAIQNRPCRNISTLCARRGSFGPSAGGWRWHNISRCDELEQRFPGLIPSILTAYKKQLGEKAASEVA